MEIMIGFLLCREPFRRNGRPSCSCAPGIERESPSEVWRLPFLAGVQVPTHPLRITVYSSVRITNSYLSACTASIERSFASDNAAHRALVRLARYTAK